MKDLWGNEVPDFEPNKKHGVDDKCKSCKYSVRISSPTAAFWKCKLIGITQSIATDINANGVCKEYLNE